MNEARYMHTNQRTESAPSIDASSCGARYERPSAAGAGCAVACARFSSIYFAMSSDRARSTANCDGTHRRAATVDAEVVELTIQLPHERGVLHLYRLMSVAPAPVVDGHHGPSLTAPCESRNQASRSPSNFAASAR